MNEYSSLKEGMLYSWGELGPSEFFIRLGGLWLVTFTVLGVPVAAASFNPSRVRFFETGPLQQDLFSTANNIYVLCKNMLQEPLRFILAAGTGTLFLVSLIVLRIYLVLNFPSFLSKEVSLVLSSIDLFLTFGIYYRGGAMLEIDYFLQLYLTKRVDGMMDKCGSNHLRLATYNFFCLANLQEKYRKSILSPTKLSHVFIVLVICGSLELKVLILIVSHN